MLLLNHTQSFAQVTDPETEKIERTSVYVIPVTDAIATPTEYIIRRGLKEAIDNNVRAVILDMNTPGGALSNTLEIMEMLNRFEGDTFTFVNSEAISAGAFIAAATDKIYMVQSGTIGAAAPIQSTGQDIPETAQKKIESYLNAKVRSMSEDTPYRAEVIQAMMDDDYELKIGRKVIKEKGTLLTLTAKEAIETYGSPRAPLLASGIASSVEEILADNYGKENFELKSFEITWSEHLAVLLNKIAPALLGIGFLLLMIEFKTPGFGIFGTLGVVFLFIVFISHYIAGLAGYEEVLIFLLGLVLIGLELFVFTGTFVLGILGVICMMGAVIWAMADIWPDMTIPMTLDVLIEPGINTLVGLGFAIVGLVLLGKYLPKSWFWDKLTLHATVPSLDPAISGGASSSRGKPTLPKHGSQGIAKTDLFPSGEVQIDGRNYQASSDLGPINQGSKVEVVRFKEFSIVVKEIKPK